MIVQVDHQRRDGLEHKVERELVLSSKIKGASADEAFDAEGNSPSKKEFELRSRFNHSKITTNEEIIQEGSQRGFFVLL